MEISQNKENELFGLNSAKRNNLLPIKHAIHFKERDVYWKYFIYGPSRYMEEADYLCIYEKNQKNSITFILRKINCIIFCLIISICILIIFLLTYSNEFSRNKNPRFRQTKRYYKR